MREVWTLVGLECPVRPGVARKREDSSPGAVKSLDEGRNACSVGRSWRRACLGPRIDSQRSGVPPRQSQPPHRDADIASGDGS